MFLTTRRRFAAVGIVAALSTPAVLTLASSAGATTAGTAPAATAAITAPYCGITWGSLPKATSPALLWTGRITGARSGQHACYDRIVFDVARGSGRLGYSVRYVDQVRGPGSGLPVPVSGAARIQITIDAPSRLAASTTNYPGWRTFRQLKSVASFEGYTDYGLGVRARLPMRTFVLTNADGGRRVVVDVAHRW